jgi:hypothetical protein
MALISGVASDVDPYILQTNFPTFGTVARYDAYVGRTQVSPASLSGTTKGILVIGDSMSANSVPTAYTPAQTGNLNLNVCNGGLYRAADPLLGASNGTGAPLIACYSTRLGDNLVAGGHCTNALMMSIAYGSTKIGDWGAAGVSGGLGTFNQDIGVAYQRFVRNGLTIHGVIWHGGPNDVTAGTSQVVYAAQLNSMISTIRALLPSVPILVGLCSDPTAPNAAIRAAQSGVVNHASQIWAGVDSDAYAADHFQPGHFSDIGSAAVASDYVTQLVAAGVVT